MAKSETTNTHLHKVLTHRNYMHHVNLQKQLNVYDRQKKVVERELLQITKVREVIQQINKGSQKNSQGMKKRGGSSKNSSKSKNDSVRKSGKVVEEMKEGTRGEGVIENGEDGPSNVGGLELFGPEDETIAQSSMQPFSMQSSGVDATLVAADKQIQANLPELLVEIDEKVKSQTTPSAENEKLFTRRRPPHTKTCSESSLVIPKVEEIVESQATRNEQCEMNRFPKAPTRMVGKASYSGSNSDENLYRKSLLANHVNTETEKNGIKENDKCDIYRLQKPRMVKGDRYSNSDENLYRKSLLSNHATAERNENEINSNGRCEIYRLSKTSTKMVKDGVYSNSDEDLYRKSLLGNHGNAGTKLPTLLNIGGSELINSPNLVKNAQSLEADKNNSSSTFGPFSNVCLVPRSRPRSKTVSDLETRKPKAAWNSPGTQRRHKELPHSINTSFQGGGICVTDGHRTRATTFQNRDICVIDRPRTRATTVSNKENSFSEYGRPRSKTESGFMHAGSQQRPARDSNWFSENTRPRSMTVTDPNENWIKTGVKSTAGMKCCRNKSQSSESLRLSEDESIAIKGKFRQLGHSVLAIALMKKMAKK